MRNVLRWVMRAVLVLLLLAAAVGFWKREQITRLMAVNSLFSQEKIVHNFSHMDGAFLVHRLPLKAPGTPLPQGPQEALTETDLAFIKARNVTSVVILRNGALTHESTYLGTGRDDQRISWSVAKSFLSALLGSLQADGILTDLDVPVTDFAPALKGSAYEGVTLRQVLTMSSGVAFNEDYLDFNSDINRMGRTLALGGSMDGFAASLKTRDHEPGTHWRYVSIDTHVIGMVFKGATGRDPAELLNERILQPLGLEVEPYYLTDGEGTAFVLGGLNLATRDYARLGQLFLQKGLWNGQQLVPADWVLNSTMKQAPGGADYGFQWWIPADSAAHGGDYFARGIYGQYIFVSPAHNAVVAVNSADRLFEEPGVDEANVAFLRGLAER